VPQPCRSVQSASEFTVRAIKPSGVVLLDAQGVQEDIHGFAVGSTDGAGERECIVDVRCHRRHQRATTSGSAAGMKNEHSHSENRHGPAYAWMNSA
jgi:hypothetical protein